MPKDRVESGEGVGPIVSSSHLASGAMPALSEMEFAMTITYNAFSRWMVRCMTAAGVPGLAPLEVQVLHAVHHRDRTKTLGDICSLLNVEDTHLVTYAIKKLVALELISTSKRGKEKTVSITKEGAAAAERYREMREALLVSSIQSLGVDEKDISRLAETLRILSGQYDQAARVAASL